MSDGSSQPVSGGPLPTGTVTFLRTDVEGSMGLTRALGERWDDVNARHVALIREAVDAHRGTVVRTEGDAVFAAFQEAGAAVAAAAAAQRSLQAHDWPDDARLRVRMGIHSGEAHRAGDDYGGIEVSRAARVAAVGHGGQIILSGPTYELTADDLPEGAAARDLGLFVLKDVPRPERLYQLDVPGLPRDFPPVRAGRTTVGNLEPRLTTFIGRDAQVEALVALLDDARLVTVTGAGGIGKTSVATEAARAVEADFADGAWLVPLATIDDAADVKALIARTIGLFDGTLRSAVETLPPFLAERSMLLVLDNFEHVLDAAPAVAELVRVSPRSRFIVTSRAPLRVTGERELPMAPLGVDGADAAARHLFVERARALLPSWDPGPESAIVDEICALVDGLPLGIELAAARVSLLPLTAIRDRLAARLPLPGSGARDVPARQRTLEGAVAWSHDLLPPRLQRGYHRLSVFEGSFDVEQAGPVMRDPDDASTADPLDDLAELADQSLVERFPAAIGVRFRMLQTIQSVAAQRLAADGDEADTRRRHADAFLDLAVAAKEHESSHDRSIWIDRLAADDANIRSAVRWAIESGDAPLALRLVAAAWRYWQVDGHLIEGRELAERAIAMPGAQGRTVERMWAVAAAGSLAYWQADMQHARRRYEEQLELARALNHEAGVVDALYNVGHAQFIEERDPAVVFQAIDGIRQRYRDLGDERGAARADWALANAMLDAGKPEESCALLERNLVRFEELDDAQYHALATATIAWAKFRLGHPDEAVGWAVRGILETYAQRDLGSTTVALTTAVLVAVILGRYDAAAQLAGAFETASERYGIRPPAALDRFIGELDPIGTAREALSPERWDLEFEAGRRLSLGQAVDLLSEIAGDVA